MSTYHAQVLWKRAGLKFSDDRYSRAHEWRFDGGINVPASASPHVVPLPFSREEAVDPEEAFVASISSCHLLWFLSIALKHGYIVDSYDDEAIGVMERNTEGKIAVTRVTLRPRISFAGTKTPAATELDALHHEAHEKCFIANSVKTEIRVESR
jgi:organic hydroperoxide reductase OsmC/OhrA